MKTEIYTIGANGKSPKKFMELTNYSCTMPNNEYYRTSFHVGKALLVVSLPGNRNGFDYYHKFIAGIIPVEDE